MFTGLVEGTGLIDGLVAEPGGVRIAVSPAAQMLVPEDPVVMGESVAINGCCLTVVDLQSQGKPDEKWSFQAGSETLSKTNLGSLAHGARVNLERAMKANARFGGHIVQGHVDGTGLVVSIEHEADWVFMAFSLAPELARQLVPKGSITVDGVSLTVVQAKDDGFSVALIPHTLQETTLGQRKVGDTVNIETDVLGKYVERLLAGR